jgi:hypothetical protein
MACRSRCWFRAFRFKAIDARMISVEGRHERAWFAFAAMED